MTAVELHHLAKPLSRLPPLSVGVPVAFALPQSFTCEQPAKRHVVNGKLLLLRKLLRCQGGAKVAILLPVQLKGPATDLITNSAMQGPTHVPVFQTSFAFRAIASVDLFRVAVAHLSACILPDRTF